MNSRAPGRDPAAYLIHPVVLGALALWLVNDHFGKGVYPGWFSGKASDVASLIVFPLVPIAALDLVRARAGKPGPGVVWIAGWVAATGAVMATINLFDWAASAYRVGLGAAQWPLRAMYESLLGHGVPAWQPVRLTMDPTDLLTLPALVVPLVLALGARAPARPLRTEHHARRHAHGPHRFPCPRRPTCSWPALWRECMRRWRECFMS